MKPVRAGLATSLIRFARPPTRLSISAHSAAVRWSFQRIARRMTLLFLSRNTEPCIWPDSPIAFTSAGLSLALAIVLRTELDRGLPPVVGVLLAPERLGEVAGIGFHGRGQDRALVVDGQGLRAGGADVDAEIDAHGGFPVKWAIMGEATGQKGTEEVVGKTHSIPRNCFRQPPPSP